MDIKEAENTIICGDSLDVLKNFSNESVNCIITSPPYWNLRDYSTKGQLGLEENFNDYILKLCNIFDECKRVLTKDGSLWVNIADTYSGTMPKKSKDLQKSKLSKIVKETKEWKGTKNIGIPDKSLCQIPQRFGIEMSKRGWIIRNIIIWKKPNQFPSSAKDRFTGDYEFFYFFVKNKKYYFKQQFEPYTFPINRWGGIYIDGNYNNSKYYQKKHLPGANTGENNKEPYKNNNPHLARINYPDRARSLRPNEKGRNKRCVWEINTKSSKLKHCAPFPPDLVKTPIIACCPANGIVLDPFCGSGTTCLVAKQLGKKYIGIDINQEYCEMARKRIEETLF